MAWAHSRLSLPSMLLLVCVLQDVTRTGTYHAAIAENRADFEGKAVMDVGAGSGILSLFAAQVRGRCRLASCCTLHTSLYCEGAVGKLGDAGCCVRTIGFFPPKAARQPSAAPRSMFTHTSGTPCVHTHTVALRGFRERG